MQYELDLSDVLLMTVHPPTALRVCDQYTECLMHDWHERRDFYTGQVDQSCNPRLSKWWALVLQLIDAAIVDPDGDDPETIRIRDEQAAAFDTFTADEIALWNETVCWHLQTNVDRDQWGEALRLARSQRAPMEQP